MLYNFEAINKARAIPLSAVRKSILLCLAFHASCEDNMCFPSYLTIEKESGASDGAIKRALDLFVALGIIAIKHRSSIKTGKETNLYHLVFNLPYGVTLKKQKGGGYKLTKEDEKIFKGALTACWGEVKKTQKKTHTPPLITGSNNHTPPLITGSDNPTIKGSPYPHNRGIRKSQNPQLTVRGTSTSKPSTIIPQLGVIAPQLRVELKGEEGQSSAASKKEERKNQDAAIGELSLSTPSGTPTHCKKDLQQGGDDFESSAQATYAEYQSSDVAAKTEAGGADEEWDYSI